MASDGRVLPDYDGACVSNVVRALFERAPTDWVPTPAHDADQVVLLVLDGFGWLELQRHRARLPNLASMDARAITTVLPSTTSTVLTSITTGAPSARHGIVGLRMRVGDGSLHVLRWIARGDGSPPDPARFQPIRPFFGRAVPVVTRSAFHSTGFTVAHLRDTQFFGWFTTSTLVERCRRLVAAGEKFVYAYYDGVDHIAHTRGLNDGFYDAELAFTDRLVGELLDVLPSSCALVVTSDHGQVDLPQGSWVELSSDLLALIDAHAGDARFRFFHARTGETRALYDAARDELADHAWVFTREQVIDERLLGPDAPTDDIASRIGDVVVAARAPVGFIDPEYPEEVRLRSGHGSMTEDEMLVPLLAGRGRA